MPGGTPLPVFQPYQQLFCFGHCAAQILLTPPACCPSIPEST